MCGGSESKSLHLGASQEGYGTQNSKAESRGCAAACRSPFLPRGGSFFLLASQSHCLTLPRALRREPEQRFQSQRQREEEGEREDRGVQIRRQRERVGPHHEEQHAAGARGQRALGARQPAQPAEPALPGSQHPQPPQPAVVRAARPPPSLQPPHVADATTAFSHGAPRGAAGP